MNPELNNELKYIEDNSFVSWVNSGFTVDNNKWQPLQNDITTQDDINKAISIVEMLHFDVVRMPDDKKKILFDRINDSTNAEEIISKEPITSSREIDITRSNKSRIWTLGIAASFLLLIFAFWPSNSTVQIDTSFAEFESVSLPDNSTVVVNANSQLNFNKSEYKNVRNLNLDGEAFFEVEKGLPFIVNTKLGKIEVLGTSFNVYARGDQFKVVCETGKVRVALLNSNTNIVLIPGEKCYLDKGELIKDKRKQKSNQWINGQFYYDGDQLKEVLAEMERQFNVQFETSDIDLTVPYTGFFNKENLNKAFESVFWTLGIKFEKSDNSKVVVLKK